jgi:NAD(P)-dependent dehydrogenase (short-subunit alcohol dehydrogenase family)
MASYMITGANRGLGLLMVTILASKPISEVSFVIAAVRNSSPALDSVVTRSSGRVVTIPVQITNEESVSKFAVEVNKVLGEVGLDVLINNAGIMKFSTNAEAGIKTM